MGSEIVQHVVCPIRVSGYSWSQQWPWLLPWWPVCPEAQIKNPFPEPPHQNGDTPSWILVVVANTDTDPLPGLDLSGLLIFISRPNVFCLWTYKKLTQVALAVVWRYLNQWVLYYTTAIVWILKRHYLYFIFDTFLSHVSPFRCAAKQLSIIWSCNWFLHPPIVTYNTSMTLSLWSLDFLV